MKIKKAVDHLMIISETELEEQVLSEMYEQGKTYGAYIKTGITLKDMVGLKVTTKEASLNKND